MHEENCSKTLLLSFFYFQNKTVLYLLFFLTLLWKQNYLRPGLTVYKPISFFDFFQINIFGVIFNGNLKNVSILKLIKNPAVLLIHKFSTGHTELVKHQIIFMKTTIEWVVGYLIIPFGGL